jgi:hypothetical protein
MLHAHRYVGKIHVLGGCFQLHEFVSKIQVSRILYGTSHIALLKL